MSPSQLKYSVTVLISFCCYILVQSEDYKDKSSLTFVIDDTGSMYDDIAQVIQGSNKIFDTVMNSDNSQIVNFILVTFNDPTTNVRTITKDRIEFKKALESIDVDGGGDCEEYSMTGIQRALEVSHKGSYVYVFTDASAKDYKIYEKVKNMAVELRSQIVFVLTGMCGSEESADYQVYHQLASATSGEVFHLGKQDVKEILDYVRYTIEGPTTLLASEKFPPGYGHKFNYTTDSKTKDSLISVAGTKPKVEVTGPDGTKTPSENIIDLDKIAIVKLKDTKPGTHTVEVGSKSETSVKVVARSEVQFKFGFSSFMPTFFDDVTSRPVPDKKCHITVKLTEGVIDLLSVKILNMDGKQIKETDLTKLSNKEKIYVTDLIDVPNTMFRIAIVGYDPETKSNITRIASSPVEPQRIKLQMKTEIDKTFDLDPADDTAKDVINKSPTVTIGKDKLLSVDYDKPLKLTCKVSGYPKPDVIWIEKKTETIQMLPANVSDSKLPYDFISVLELEHVKENATYQCKAENKLGSDAKEIVLEIKTFLEILEKPKDTTIEYNKEGNIYCKIKSYPKANITWYKIEMKDTLTDNPNIELITNDSTSVLRIKSMGISDVGTYVCEAKNGIQRKLLRAEIYIYGVEPPVIDKDIFELNVKLHEDTNITCSIIKGIPKPTINWYKKDDTSELLIEMFEWFNREVVYLRHAQKKDQGVYACMAENEFGQDYKEVDVFVEYPPSIKEGRKYIQVIEKQDIFLTCLVDGYPTPDVEWYKNGIPVAVRDKDYVYENNTLKIHSVTVKDTSNYTCLASNRLGVANKTIYIKVHVPVHISTKKNETYNVKVGSRLILSCKAEGVPTPRIIWKNRENNITKKVHKSIKTDATHKSTLLFERIQLKDEGIYDCIAWNSPVLNVASYEVRVHSPPIIENMYPDKVFKPVKGDLVLRINCTASGSPKPTINWIKDGYYVALSDSYYIENGTLVIKNIDKKDSGTYVCEANNYLGKDTEAYEVEVLDAPPVKDISRTVLVSYGGTANIDCNIPRKLTDRLTWYKDGRFLKIGELTMSKAKLSDTGHYSCRVNDFVKSATENVEIKVGFKPVFNTDKPEDIEMVSGIPVFLNCEATGIPEPELHWWHNEVNINSSDFIYAVEPSIDNQGLYYCNVKNDFGAIVRKFNVHSRDCIISLNETTSKQPLMLSSSLTRWPKFHISDENFMIIPRDEYINLFCPSRFTKFPFPYIIAFCDGGSKFKINGKSTDFTEIFCTDNVHHIVQETGEKCLPANPNAEKIKISFKVLRESVEVYEVCFDKKSNSPIYTKVYMVKDSISKIIKPKWSDGKYFHMNFDEMYDCERQSEVITTTLKKRWHKDDGCCFRKRQLVNEKDVFPGVAQEAVSSYFNIVPQWGTCNSENWDDLERSVRMVSKLSYSDILVWTGVSGNLYLSTAFGKQGRIRIVDRTRHQQPVPKYLWKVIQNPAASSSVAIIQMNIPDLKTSEVLEHVLCPNICSYIKWINGSNFNDVDKGYIYCCTLDEFEKAFNMTGVFEPHNFLLRNVDAAPFY